MKALSTVIFNTLVRLKVCHKPVRTYDVGAPSAITISLPGMDPADAERRRYSCTVETVKGKSESPLSKVLPWFTGCFERN